MIGFDKKRQELVDEPDAWERFTDAVLDYLVMPLAVRRRFLLGGYSLLRKVSWASMSWILKPSPERVEPRANSD